MGRNNTGQNLSSRFFFKLGPEMLDLGVLVHTAQNPTDAEWDEYLKLVEKANLSKLRTLVFTAGGGPTSTQRKKVHDILRGQSTPVALISSSALVRGIATALGWFNVKVRLFGEDNPHGALDFLQIPRVEHDRISAAVTALQRELGYFEEKSAVGYR